MKKDLLFLNAILWIYYMPRMGQKEGMKRDIRDTYQGPEGPSLFLKFSFYYTYHATTIRVATYTWGVPGTTLSFPSQC